MFYDGVLTATYKNIFKFLKVTLCTMLPTENVYCRWALCDFLNGG
jgi:hypothetical protein